MVTRNIQLRLNWEDAWFIRISMLSIAVLAFLPGEGLIFSSTLREGPRSGRGACVITERYIEPTWVSVQAVSLAFLTGSTACDLQVAFRFGCDQSRSQWSVFWIGHQYSEFSAAAVLASNNGNFR